jgi:uncharacterized protein YbaR (Trm112 family)
MGEEKASSGSAPPAGAGYPETCGVPPDLLLILVCPMAHAELKLEDGQLVCTRCGPRFAIEDGIPIMLIEEAKLPDGVARIEDLPCYQEVKAREERVEGDQG